MRSFLTTAAVFACVAIASPAWAQIALSGNTTTGEPHQRAAPLVTEAPTPEVGPRTSPSSPPQTLAMQISPPGLGSTDAGPANSTPFSAAPSGTLPGDADESFNRSGVEGGNIGGTPNLSK